MATARPTTEASNIPGLRARALQSVFPGLPMPTSAGATPAANSPATPANTREFAMRAPTPNHLSAAARAAQAVASHLAANPVKTPKPYVAPTRENTPLTQSAGTINTNYINSARAQGYNNVTPPNIFRGAREGVANPFTPGTTMGARNPTHDREFFRNQVFVPTAQQARLNLFSPPTPPAPTPQIGVPAPTFPPRNQFLNVLFPR